MSIPGSYVSVVADISNSPSHPVFRGVPWSVGTGAHTVNYRTRRDFSTGLPSDAWINILHLLDEDDVAKLWSCSVAAMVECSQFILSPGPLQMFCSRAVRRAMSTVELRKVMHMSNDSRSVRRRLTGACKYLSL